MFVTTFHNVLTLSEVPRVGRSIVGYFAIGSIDAVGDLILAI